MSNIEHILISQDKLREFKNLPEHMAYLEVLKHFIANLVGLFGSMCTSMQLVSTFPLFATSFYILTCPLSEKYCLLMHLCWNPQVPHPHQTRATEHRHERACGAMLQYYSREY